VFKAPILGLVFIPLFALILGCFYTFTGAVDPFYFVMLFVGVFATEFGVTFGYHRLVVHKSFEPHPVLKAIVLALGSMTFQGPVVNWASVHTKHHAHSDQEGDPHSPTISGFLYAHFEWLIEMHDDELDEIKAKWGARYMKDPMVAWFSNTFLMWCAIGLVTPAIIGFAMHGWEGAWMGFLFGGLIRIFFSSHITWSVNSFCHYFGKRMFTTTDKSRNNPIVGIFALGEGWHNNHHAFPASAFHGMKWYQVDFTGLAIRFFEKVGLVRKVVRIPQPLLEKRLNQTTAVEVQLLDNQQMELVAPEQQAA